MERPFSQRIRRSAVAQISNLPYRRFPICRPSLRPTRLDGRHVCRLQTCDTADWKSALQGLATLGLVACLPALAADAAPAPSEQFRKTIQPILVEYCYDCHGDGMNKGQVAFDGFKSHDELLAKRDLWLAVLKNTRAGIMPPEKKPRPSAEQQRFLENWIKSEVFAIDPANPDPGRVTIRRLNRVEYRNTIRDLMGHDFKVEDELPPDDTGYGFDTIGDVLSMSPLLLEKYMQAAETIVGAAVPRVGRVVAEKTIAGNAWRNQGDKQKGDRFSFYDEAKLSRKFQAEHSGSYRLVLEFEVLGQFDFDPGRCRVVFKVDDHEAWQQEFGWQAGKKFRYEVEQKWEAGERRLAMEIQPLTPVADKKNSLDLRLIAVRVQGPLEEKYWGRPKNFELFFTKDVPEGPDSRKRWYAKETLGRFASRAFRRPIDERSLDRLTTIAENYYREPGKRFEDGVAQAMIPVLASPRFLFRVEEVEDLKVSSPSPLPSPQGGGGNAGSASSNLNPTDSADRGLTGSLSPRERAGVRGNSASDPPQSTAQALGLPIDEYSLASRLSYFLWSAMPDAELFRLAEQHKLRKNLAAQMKRMLADPRSEAFVENFVGQWLQVRDVEGIDINVFAVLARDRGEERTFNRNRRRFQELREIPEEKLTPEQKKEIEEFRAQFRNRQRNRPQVELDRDLRRALRQETEMTFAHILHENRSALELLDSDYTFLNERLAKHYGLTNLNVSGAEMRRVSLPADSPRGGVLTEGAPLIVTSNPTRTSPVKRGLFILDNILGLPTPPPPPNIPNLEDSEKAVEGRQPTLRETLAIHREKPLCASCHNRMDPLGLALENFNALGMWRDKERGQPIDAAGRLITGETFTDIREVKRVLTTQHRLDFYRCLAEKLFTYALGRGVEYYDTQTMDDIVGLLDKDNGRLSTLVTAIIESVPFQKRRNQNAPGDAEPPKPVEQRADNKP
jgi:hypothetical protein